MHAERYITIAIRARFDKICQFNCDILMRSIRARFDNFDVGAGVGLLRGVSKS
jgi:hypothetical protein